MVEVTAFVITQCICVTAFQQIRDKLEMEIRETEDGIYATSTIIACLVAFIVSVL